MGVGAIALMTMLNDEHVSAIEKDKLKPEVFDLSPKQPVLEPQAKAMISLFQHGGPAHMDLFDPKPELSRLDGKSYDGDIAFSFIKRATKKLKGSPWKFQKHGECGTEISELLPETAKNC